MNIGDKVRSIRGNEEGNITNILPHNEIEVEIEDGFRIPFQARDLTVVSKTENEHFGKTNINARDNIKTVKRIYDSYAEKGVYIAMPAVNDKLLEMVIINNTDLQLLYTCGNQNQNEYTGINSGILEGRSLKKLSELNMDKFDNWGSFLFQFMLHKKGPFEIKNPKIKKLRFKGASFFNSKSKAPLLDKEAFLFQLDKQEVEVKPEEIIEKLYTSNDENTKTKEEKKKIANSNFNTEIDLHIDKIQPNHSFIPENEILKIQLEFFEKNLDKAIFIGADKITFIHGVGNGVLKEEIQKRLAQNSSVDYFKDAQKGKFGYGATELKLK